MARHPGCAETMTDYICIKFPGGINPQDQRGPRGFILAFQFFFVHVSPFFIVKVKRGAGHGYGLSRS
jgi:hypothetical protein